MELFEGMMTQKSIRYYTDEPVTEEEILQCLRAAIQAPNGGNLQLWQWVVVTDAEKRRRIGELYKRAHGRFWAAISRDLELPESEEERDRMERGVRSGLHLAEHMGEAPAMVMLLGPAEYKDFRLTDDDGPMDIGETYYTSLVPALQNFMLAARGLGIGTCLTTAVRIHHDEIREVCGIPDEYEIEVLVPMGRPRGKFGVAPRRPAESVTSWDTFGAYRAPAA